MRINTLRNCLLGLFVFSVFVARSQNVGINTTGAAPAASAILDLSTGVTDLGFLAPQASLLSNVDVATIAAPAIGLIVYNTNAAIASGAGYYYWNGALWAPIGGSKGDWLLTGNSNTAPATNWIGTNDGEALQFKVNGQNSGWIDFNGNSTTFLGYQAGILNTAANNTGFGFQALTTNVAGVDNTAVGFNALFHNTASNNTAMGYFSLVANTNGQNDAAFGLESLFSATGTNDNSAFGSFALKLTNASQNTGIGYRAGASNVTGSYNTYLGMEADGGAAFVNSTAVGALAFIGASNVIVLGSINGINTAATNVNVGIGVDAPVSQLDNTGTVGMGIVDIPTQANGFSGPLIGFGEGSTYIANPPTLVASTYTLVLPSPVAFPRQIFTIVYNGTSLGTINIQTPLANTIDATGTLSTNFPINAGSVVMQSDGTNWNVIGETFAVSVPTQLLGVKVFKVAGAVASQAFDNGTTSIQFKLVGGGGSGGGISSTAALPGTCGGNANIDWDGAGGGAGGYCEGFLNGITAASTFSGNVGAGGVGGVPTLGGTACALTYTPPAGANGGQTNLTVVAPAGGPYTANGGTGGGTTEESTTGPNSIVLAGGAGGTAAGGAINITGSSGGDCVVTFTGSNMTDEGGSGGGSIYGTGGFGNLTRDPFPLTGNNATGVGAGGAGACCGHAAHGSTANTNGGNGAAGLIIIYEY